MNNYGFQNEKDFVEFFNEKHYYEFDNNTKKFLSELYEGDINDEDVFKAWKNKVNQKTDIFIKCKNMIKRISLKCGKDNSVHQEIIQDFKMYLEKLGLSFKVISYYTSYHYGYMRDEDGNIDFSKSLSSIEYKSFYQKEIDIFNKHINKTKLIIDMIDRFIVKGKNSDYDIDVLVCGTIDDYVWIMKHDIYDLILSKRCLEYTSPHIACMTIGPKKRNLERNSKYSKERYIVTIRWNFIKESIIEYKNSMKNSRL